VAVGDFNGDGKPDLAVGGSPVAVLLGNGDGTFQPAVNSGPGGGPVVADINGDGKLDLVNRGSVRLGNGDGTFKPAVNFSTGASPISVAVGDFTATGNLTWPSPNAGLTTSQYCWATAMAPFNPPSTMASQRTPYSVAVGDFNGDARPTWPWPLALATSRCCWATGMAAFGSAVNYSGRIDSSICCCG